MILLISTAEPLSYSAADHLINRHYTQNPAGFVLSAIAWLQQLRFLYHFTVNAEANPWAITSLRTTISDWQEAKRQTGKWPLLSITTFALFFGGVVTAVVIFLRYADQHSWSSSHSKLMALLLLIPAVPYVIIWGLIERKVRLYELRNHGPATQRVNECNRLISSVDES